MFLLTLLTYSAPVALAAVGETVGQKSGVINIGLEGMMLLGAFVAVVAAIATGSPWIGLAAAVAVGIAVSLASGWFTIGLGIDQVVVGTAVNLLALGLTGTLFRAQFGQSGQLLRVPAIPNWNGVDAVLILLVLSAVGIWFALYRTGWGLALRASGEYPKAAEAAGFSVSRLRFGAVAIAGVFAGLAGGYLALGVAGSFAENMTAGRGFIAIAMVTFGRWNPPLVFAAALLIGYAQSLQYRFQTLGWDVPFHFILALPYVIALLVLVAVGRGTRAPAALAQAYHREK
jgi:general nucleoside transport system permease protein